MKQFGLKFRLIFLPFVVIWISTNCIYSLFHLLLIRTSIQINEEILNFWVPFLLPIIPLYFWLRPRVKLLKINTKGRRDPVGLYIFVAWLSIGASLIITQEYLNTATGQLTKLNEINQINKLPKTKYYMIRHFYASKKLARIKPAFEVSGRNSEHLIMKIFAPCPIFNSDDTAALSSSLPVAWLGVKFSKTISNNLSNEEKESDYKDFAAESQREFDQKNLSDFIYLDRINYSSDFKNYTEAVNSDKYPAINNDIIILSPVNEPFEARNGSKLQWIFGSFGIGAAIFLIAPLFSPLRRNAASVDLKEQSIKERNKALLFTKSLFSFKGNALGLRILIGLNLIMFIIMAGAGLGFMSFSGEDLLKWGANYRPLVLEGQYWRLFTCMFLHGGVMHILFNMYGLFFAGIILEPVIGLKKFLVVYLITGILSSIASIWWHPATVSVGASGAIFGMYGVFLALLTVNVFPPEIKRPFLINTLVFIGYNLLMGIRGGIDNAAHIGGLISGILAGYILYLMIKSELENKPPKSHQKNIKEININNEHDVLA